MARRRMNLVIDQDVLADAHKASGKSTYSETVNNALREAARVDKFRSAMQHFDAHRDEMFMPGYREEFWLGRGNPKMARAVREEEAKQRQAVFPLRSHNVLREKA